MVKWWALFYFMGFFFNGRADLSLLLVPAAALLSTADMGARRMQEAVPLRMGRLKPRHYFLLAAATSLIFYSAASQHKHYLERGDGQKRFSTEADKSIDKKQSRPSGIALAVREYIAGRFDSGKLSDTSRSLAKAVLLADKRTLPRYIVDSFRNSGIAHLLALSGLHLGIIILPFTLITRFSGKGSRFAWIIISAIILAYCAVAGFPPSLVRAASLFLAASITKALNTRADLTESLIAGTVAILVLFPSLAYETGFRLSFLAVAGLSMIGIPILNRLKAGESCGVVKKLVIRGSAPMIVTVSVNIALLPYILYLYGRCPLISPVVNFAVILPFTAFLYGSIIYVLLPFELLRNGAACILNSMAKLVCIIPVELSEKNLPAVYRGEINMAAYTLSVLMLAAAIAERARRGRLLLIMALLLGLISFLQPSIATQPGGGCIVDSYFGDIGLKDEIRYSSCGGGIITVRRGVSRYVYSRLMDSLNHRGIVRVKTVILCSADLYSEKSTEIMIRRLGVEKVICSGYLYLSDRDLLDRAMLEEKEIILASSGEVIDVGGAALAILGPEYPPAEGESVDFSETMLKYNLIVE